MSAESELIQKAIETKKVITFYYDGCHRIVEPHHYGILNKKNQLQAYQVGGASKTRKPAGWKNFELNKIDKLSVNDNTFKVREDHNPSNSKYSMIKISVSS